MKAIFDNLYIYEIVLLFLGVFLFMLLCAGLVYFIIRKDDLKKLLLFFPIPIIMIAYPSIQEIQIEKDKFALKKYSDEVIENPNDTVAHNELVRVTEKLEKRATTVEDLKAVAEANLLLGNPEKAIDLTNKAIENKEDVIYEPIKDKEEDSLINGLPNIEILQGIKTVATIQKEIESDPSALKDTIILKEQIDKIYRQNPKTKKYLNQKILMQQQKKVVKANQ
ncbi:hypothetical protein [Aquimarina sediminis]|uniref:hypothetical protein n=1 Tax=Aquimarina sediminis TaxID=2070536 RepID=UPI000FFEC3B8|nr:hypothetical protein [Aquimarina sediminis]